MCFGFVWEKVPRRRSILLVIVPLLILAGYVYETKETKEMSRISKLGEPPSVILAPPKNFCQGFLYLVVLYTRVNEPQIRLRFRHSYGSLSSRSYSLCNFVRENCTDVRAVLKVDDDAMFNARKMFEEMGNMDVSSKQLYCVYSSDYKPKRTRSKWAVTVKEYPPEWFPTYCWSPAYFATPSTILALYNVTSKVPFLWIDDVFSTGIVGAAAGVSYQKILHGNAEMLRRGEAHFTVTHREKCFLLLFDQVNGNYSTSASG
ncbi:hypothetical protein RB195_021251 [Necator americanus]|uniref:Hexosyltransferase n=1 Tax=Necator americanus TaxID=51031 RepID=A0ABR1EAS2_NECAM